MVKKLMLIGLAFVAARMARKAMRREAEIISLLWTLIQVTAGIGSVPPTSAKTRSAEARLNAAMPRIPWPVAAPGTTAGGTGNSGNTSYNAGNSSYPAGDSTYATGNSSYNDNDSLQGAAPGGYSQTSCQAAINRINNLIPTINALRDSYSSTVPMVNTLQNSHSGLVTAFNVLRNDHSNLVPVVNALRDSYSNTVTAVNAVVADHNQLVNDHNNLRQALQNTNVLQ